MIINFILLLIFYKTVSFYTFLTNLIHYVFIKDICLIKTNISLHPVFNYKTYIIYQRDFFFFKLYFIFFIHITFFIKAKHSH